MATTSFTARIDADLKADLERIAQFEERSASYIATQAIRALVEEYKATRGLVETGQALIGQGAPSLAPDAVHDWFMQDDDAAFPAPEADS